jgi:ubiquinone/menaquinone biosynthesis C-methylase UbiE
MYNPDRVSAYYDEFGMREWERLDTSAHARLVLHLHNHFLKEHIGPDKKVLDAGCGAGRFAVHIAQSGSRVTLLDVSEEQISLAEARFKELELDDRADGFFVEDICDLGVFEDHTFDTTVCYGGALNYLFENATRGLSELIRVTKPGGSVLVSVMSRWGVIRMTIGSERLDPESFLGRPDYWMIPQVAETGDLWEHPELTHPPRHFFDSAELRALLGDAGLERVELGSTPSVSASFYARLDLVEQHPNAWKVVLDLEERAYRLPGMLDSGEHLLAKGSVPDYDVR